MKRIDTCFSAILVLLIGSCFAFGQVTTVQVATGTPQFGSFGGGPFDAVNLGNLNVHFAVPVVHKAGRGMDFTYDLSYDSSIWSPVVGSGSTNWMPVINWGWRGQTEVATGFVTYTVTQSPTCFFGGVYNGTVYVYSNWTYHDPVGSMHMFPGSTNVVVPSTGFCSSSASSMTGVALDGTGWTVSATGSGLNSITSKSGAVLHPPLNATSGAASTTDANGNQITVNSSGQFFDTLSSTTAVLTTTGSGTPASPLKFGYVPPANIGTGTRVNVQVNYVQYTVKTNFGATDSLGHTILEYPATSNALADNIVLPDGTAYHFLYEHTPGTCTPLSGTFSGYCVTARIASVTLPTGGQITYAYSGGSNGIINDGSTAGLSRTVNPGGVWGYSRSQVSGNHWSTTVSAPDPVPPTLNITYFDFAKDSASSNPTYNFYETQRIVNQGSSTALKTFFNCYNANFTNCTGATVSSPITQKDAYEQLNSGSSTLSEVIYDSTGFGLPLHQKDFDWGQTLVRDTMTTYNTTLGNGIVDRPSSVVLKDSTGTVQAQTNYTYDETTPTATTGTPQHIAITGSRGNVTTVGVQANGTTTLYRKFAYYDTGTLNTSTDVSTSSTANGATTTYTYGAGSCGNSFITSISEPLSLSRSVTWDCTGGVLLSLTDENGKIASTSYTDQYFWRPASVTDQASNVTAISYPSATRIETALTFNSGSSVSDHLIQLDGFGRQIVSQTKQGPSSTSFDSVETDYDVVGRVSKVTLPYNGSAGTLCSGTCPSTSFSYDALDRLKNATDGGSGSTTYTYTNNYVNQALSPAPVGENVKQKEMVFDGIGRLASVCEITTGSGSNTCSVGSSPTGYWTTYTYDVLDDLKSVTQNAQAAPASQQSRSYSYDRLGRLTDETNPEANNVAAHYLFDTSASGCTNVNPAGNLTKRVDPAGNVACYNYDTVHRVTSIAYSGTTPMKNFVYDAATVNGTAMSNAKTRLAEAYTCTTCPGTKITDLGFSYSNRGEVTGTWQSSTNSGGYYHLTANYWPHGPLNSISGLPTMPTFYYGASDGTGLDGEGRITKVTASSGQNPVTGVTYSTSTTPVGALTQVVYGSGDSDSFTPDSNTGRMNKYVFKMGASATDTGTLTWNPNGSLKTLAITDLINTNNTQTCNYLYDDLGRSGLPPGSSGKSVDCGSTKWQQNFSYDPFGNIAKAVPTGGTGLSFQATYNTTNRIQTLPGFNPTYDGNGNLTNDSVHTYSWDAENNPVQLDSAGVIYDAMGRMVQINASTYNTEWVYSPTGEKLGLMLNGTSFAGAWIPMPGGGRRLFQVNGTTNGYVHPDWLGSARLVTSDTQTLISDVAYAPYGEDYAVVGGYLQFTWPNLGELTVSAGGGQGLFDFDFRKYSPSQGRWISPDPAGLAAVNPSNPQSWNRYGYVGNNPLSAVDPTGLYCDAKGDCPIGGGPDPCAFDITCFPPLPPCLDCGGGGGGGGRRDPDPGSGGGGGGGRRIGGKWPNGETLGLPTGLNLKPMGLAGLIGLSPGTSCDFGVCVTITNSLLGSGIPSGMSLDAGLLRFLAGIPAFAFGKKARGNLIEGSTSCSVNPVTGAVELSAVWGKLNGCFLRGQEEIPASVGDCIVTPTGTSCYLVNEGGCSQMICPAFYRGVNCSTGKFSGPFGLQSSRTCVKP